MARAMSGTLDAVDEAAPMESFSTAAFATHEPYPLPSEHMFRCGYLIPLPAARSAFKVLPLRMMGGRLLLSASCAA